MTVTTARASLEQTAELADEFRIRSIEMADRAGSGHPTSSMSAADLVAVLVARHLRLDPGAPDAIGNDRLLFSKGHASPLLYAALDSLGLLDGMLDEFDGAVDAYRQPGSPLEGHPTPDLPAVPTATGSLGLGLSVGIGLTLGNQLRGRSDAHVWVVCGDGEMAEGSVWEAVEHAGWAPVNGLTAIIDVNRLGQTGPTRHGWDLDAYRRRFEAFDWRAIEVDGHDHADIDAALEVARSADAPTAIIARTVKGHGATETEDQEGKHGKPLDEPGRAIVELGGRRRIEIAAQRPDHVEAPTPTTESDVELPSWEVGDEVATRDAFGDVLVALGRSRPGMVVLDGEVGNSTRTDGFADDFGDRFVQAYIAEQLMTGIAVGLDASGCEPVLSSFGSFLTRAHDVLRMASIGRANLLVAGTHAGVSIGEDGPSQMALDDVAMMRAIAGSTVVSPSDANQTAALVAALADVPGIRYVRLMRGATPVVHRPDTEVSIGGSAWLGSPVRVPGDPDVVLLASGVTVHEAVAASRSLSEEHIDAPVLDLYSIEPIHDDAIERAARCGRLVVVEDHRPAGGLGEAVLASLARTGSTPRVAHLAVRGMPGSAPPDVQRRLAGIDAGAIAGAARRLLDRR